MQTYKSFHLVYVIIGGQFVPFPVSASTNRSNWMKMDRMRYFLILVPQQAHYVYRTSYQSRCNVLTEAIAEANINVDVTLSQHRVPTASVHILLQSYHARNLLFGAYKVFDGPSEPSNQNVNEKKKIYFFPNSTKTFRE